MKPEVHGSEFSRSPVNGSFVKLREIDSLKLYQRSLITIALSRTETSFFRSTYEAGSWSGFSRSPEHGSFVELREIDSLTSRTQGMKKSRKFIRPNHQFPRVPAKPEVRGHQRSN